jgi:hypothetical protein
MSFYLFSSFSGKMKIWGTATATPLPVLSVKKQKQQLDLTWLDCFNLSTQKIERAELSWGHLSKLLIRSKNIAVKRPAIRKERAVCENVRFESQDKISGFKLFFALNVLPYYVPSL